MNIKFSSVILTIFFSCLAFQNMAQSHPETIQKITQVCKTHEYYTAQKGLWKQVVDKNPTNADAWYNYYKASRYAHITSGYDTVFNKSRFQSLRSIIDGMERHIPNSFEFHICKWVNEGNDSKNLNHLERAHALRPNEVEPIIDLLTYSEFQGDTTRRNDYARRWFQLGQTSPGLLNYNYNVLQSLKPNAILMTYGDNDTYPLWILQAVFHVRADVKVINTSMVYRYDYAKIINRELGINLPNCEENSCQMTSMLLDHLPKNKSQRPVYLTLTSEMDADVKSKHFAHLYLTGLAYEYSDKKLDNLGLMKKNVEKKFALDYLTISFSNDHSVSSVREINTNYVIPFLTLYKHYMAAEEIEKAKYYRGLVEQIMTAAHREGELMEIFK